ncbi:MAG TPA: WD40 repeat domain-containing protein, partial [Actinomycetota bacterium]
LSGHDGLVALVDFSPDGTRLLTGGGDGTARVWDVSDTAGAELWTQQVASENVSSVAYGDDGTYLVTSGEGGVWVLDPSTGARVTPVGWAWDDASFNREGDLVAASGYGAELMDVASGEVVRTLDVTGSVPNIEFSPDGSLVATGLGNFDTNLGEGRAVLWDAESGRRVRMFGPSHRGDHVQGLAFSPDGQVLAVLSGRGRLEVWAVDTGERLMSIDDAHPGNGSDLAFLPDGRLVTVGGDGGVVWAVPSDKPLLSFSGGSKLGGVAVSRDGARIATAGADRKATIWDAATGGKLLELELPNAVTSIAFSPDGTELATGDANGIVRVFALRVDDLVRLARQRLSGLPTSPGPSLPSPSTSSGPQGAFLSTIMDADLLRRGFPKSELDGNVGDYTLSLTDGNFLLRQRLLDGSTWETFGTYTISGDRITLTEWADAGCAGNRFSAVWRSQGPVLRLSHVRPEIVPGCDPEVVSAWARAVFASHPFTIVGGAMGG